MAKIVPGRRKTTALPKVRARLTGKRFRGALGSMEAEATIQNSTFLTGNIVCGGYVYITPTADWRGSELTAPDPGSQPVSHNARSILGAEGNRPGKKYDQTAE